jgi:GT2 family glycosyltransferase
MSHSLAVSIVVYHPDGVWLNKTLSSLRAAIDAAFEASLIASAVVSVVDNGASESSGDVQASAAIKAMIDSAFWSAPGPRAIQHAYIATPRNGGYGAGNNTGLRGTKADYVLIVNPDVEMERHAVVHAIQYLAANPVVGAVTPVASFPDGAPQYLVKRHPSVVVLALRGFMPGWIKRRFAKVLARYDFQDAGADTAIEGCEFVSGCWLLVKGACWRQTGGFDELFFLYFEDFDLSLRMSKIARIDRVPQCRIVHAGGNASRKGMHHIRLFASSAVRFFNKHGWHWGGG